MDVCVGGGGGSVGSVRAVRFHGSPTLSAQLLAQLHHATLPVLLPMYLLYVAAASSHIITQQPLSQSHDTACVSALMASYLW